MISEKLLENEKDQKKLILGTALAGIGILLIGVGIGFGAQTFFDGSVTKDQAGRMLSSAISQASGSEVSVVDVESENGLYKVSLNSNNQLQTIYVTKDGSRFTTSLNNLTNYRRTVTLQSSTSNCLSSKNVTMYGNITQRATQVQIQLMGGTQKVEGYYRDVNRPGVLQQAAQNGIRRIPAFFMNGETLTGVNNLSAVREFAGCTS